MGFGAGAFDCRRAGDEIFGPSSPAFTRTRFSPQMSPRAIAALAGRKVGTVIEMLKTYGHCDTGALDEVPSAAKGGVHRMRS
jgi:hypothetical protein